MTDLEKATGELDGEIRELKERYGDLKELIISSTLELEALIELLSEKGIITRDGLMRKVEKDRGVETAMQTLPTWARRKEFRYSGSVKEGVTIKYGIGFNLTQHITAKQFRDLLDYFHGRTVNIGTSRTNPPPGSVGEWLQNNVTKIAMASYIGPILVNENYATKLEGPMIKFE